MRKGKKETVVKAKEEPEYIPTAQDLQDFEEFCAEREGQGEPHYKVFDDRRLRVYRFPNFRNGGDMMVLRTTAIETIMSFLSSLSDYATYTRQQIIDVLSLFRIDRDIIREIMDPTLTEKEFDDIVSMESDYPYLHSYWNSIFGANIIRAFREMIDLDRYTKGHILPYSVFLAKSYASQPLPTKIEIKYSKRQLIHNMPPHQRPLYGVRIQLPLKPELVHCTDPEASRMIMRQLRNLNHLPTLVLSDQFDIDSAYKNKTDTMKFSMSISALKLFVEYFELPIDFTGVPDNATFSYILKQWKVVDYEDEPQKVKRVKKTK